MGLRRLRRYYTLRIVRLSAAPEPLARAIACGVSIAFFPVFGMHTVGAAAAAYLMRANVVAAALASAIIPPVILPLFFSLDFLVGRKILRWFGFFGQGTEAGFVRGATAGSTYVSDNFFDLFLPALTGSVIFMMLTWPAVYMAAHKLIDLLARRHRARKTRTREAA